MGNVFFWMRCLVFNGGMKMIIVVRKDVYIEILKKSIIWNEGLHPRGVGGKFITKLAPDKGDNLGGYNPIVTVNSHVFSQNKSLI